MKTFYSTKSFNSNMLTFLLSLVAILLLLSLSYLSNIYSKIYVIIIIALLLFVMCYWYFKSLNKIKLTHNAVILYKHMGKETIPFADIKSVKKIELPLSDFAGGSNGICGYNGLLDDGSKIFVNNCKTTFKIEAVDYNYIVSCDKRDKLIKKISSKLQQVEFQTS